MAKPASADIFSTGNPTAHPFNYSFSYDSINFEQRSNYGGDLLGTLNGDPLYATYCVNLNNYINLGTTYDNTAITYDGTVYGEAINNAGAISWLLTNIAVPTLTLDEQNGLQAAIWKTEYGINFQVDGVDNGNGGNSIDMTTAYQNYLALLGNNTAPVSDILWISADNTSPLSPHAQGLIGLQNAPVPSGGIPEPGSIAFVLAGGLPLIGLIAKRRRSS